MSDLTKPVTELAASGGADGAGGSGAEPVITINGASVAYGDTTIVSKVNCAIEPNQFVTILGPNGCGKTTLLSAMLGLQPLSEGTITVADEVIAPPQSRGWGMSRKRAQQTRALASVVALVSQSHRSTFPFHVIDLVLTGRLPYIGVASTPSAEDVTIADDALETLGIQRLRNRLYTTLSGGERQMVLIARALAQQTDVLYLDEPTTYLDIANQERVLQTVKGLVENLGKTVIAIIHEPNHAIAYADKVLLLGARRAPETSVLAWGSPRGALTAEVMEQAYGLDVAKVTTDHGDVVIPLR